MNEQLSSEALALLEAVVVGDRTRDDEVVRKMAADNPAFGARLEELDEVRDLLEQTSQEARRTRNDASSWRDAPGEGRMREAVGLARPRRPQKWNGGWKGIAFIGGLVAAGVALFLFLGGGSEPVEEFTPVFMGETQVRLIGPRDEVDSYAPFRWEGELPEGCTFRLQVFDATGPVLPSTPTLEYTGMEDNWTPDSTQLERLGSRIWIELRVISSEGRELSKDSASARR